MYKALIASLILGGVIINGTVGAQTLPTPATTIAPNTPGTLVDGDDIPSCSLFPTRLGLGRWIFTNRRDFPITLQIITRSTDGISAPIGTEVTVFDGTLAGGQSTPEFVLTPDTTIHWAGGTYHLSAYDIVGCLENGTTIPITTPLTVSSTTTPPISTTVPPTTATTPTTITSTTPTTVPHIVTQATPTLTAFVEYFPPRTPIAQTGFPFGLVALGGVSLVLIGLMFLAIRRKDALERRG